MPTITTLYPSIAQNPPSCYTIVSSLVQLNERQTKLLKARDIGQILVVFARSAFIAVRPRSALFVASPISICIIPGSQVSLGSLSNSLRPE